MWSDRDTDQDFLGYASYVSVLAETCTMKDLAPLTLGIFGAWGSGKTSLMRMLQAKVDSTPGVNAKTLWFNAWRYEGREEAQSALIHAVLAKLAEDKTLWQETKETFEKLKKGASVLKLAKVMTTSVMTMTPQINEFIDCFKEESEKIAETMETFDKDFEELLSKAKVERIVVFIDDLDRCSSAKVIETFETIKLFLNTPACTFVNPCRCPKKTKGFIEAGHVDPGHLQFVPLPLRCVTDAAEGVVRTIENTVDEQYAAIFREHPFLEPKDQIGWLRQLLDNGDFGKALHLN